MGKWAKVHAREGWYVRVEGKPALVRAALCDAVQRHCHRACPPTTSVRGSGGCSAIGVDDHGRGRRASTHSLARTPLAPEPANPPSVDSKPKDFLASSSVMICSLAGSPVDAIEVGADGVRGRG